MRSRCLSRLVLSRSNKTQTLKGLSADVALSRPYLIAYENARTSSMGIRETDHSRLSATSIIIRNRIIHQRKHDHQLEESKYIGG